MFLIDTNMLVSEILTKYEQDGLTLQYKNFFHTIPLVERIIPDVVLSEFEIYTNKVAPSRYRMDEKEKKEIKNITNALLQTTIEECTIISPSPTTIKYAYVLYKRFQNAHYISFTDSLLLATAHDNGYTLITKDQRLTNHAKELHIPCFEP